MDDLIKRSDAIEAIEVVDWYHQNRNKDMVSGANSDEHQAWYKAEDVYKALEEVPSADRPNEVIYGNEHNCIMTVFGECSYAETGCGDCAVVEKVRKALSADRPQGEWKHLGGDEWLCSECGYVIWTEGSWEHPLERGKDYCEHCGAKMKGADDEID